MFILDMFYLGARDFMNVSTLLADVKKYFAGLKQGGRVICLVMRLFSAWLSACCLQYLFGRHIFNKEFAGEINPLVFILTAVGAYFVFTAIRFIPVIKKMNSDGWILLSVSAFTAVIVCISYNKEQGAGIGGYLAVAPFFALALWQVLSKLKLRVPSVVKKCWLAVIILGAAVMFLFCGISIALRYYTMRTPAFDFGIFAQMFENMKDTFEPVTTLERNRLLSHFAVHFSPAYYLMLPFYMIFPHPVTLQILQGLIVTSGVIPAFLICRKYNLSKLKCAAVCVVYALYPAFTGGCSYDLHENCMLLPLLLWLFWAVEREKLPLIAVFAVAVLSVKEDAAVYTAVVGLYMILSDRSRRIKITGAVVLVVSLGYFIGVCAYLESMGLGVMTWRYDNYMYSGQGGLVTVIFSLILNPAYVFSNLLSGDKAVFALEMLAPLAFIPLVSRKFHRYILLVPFILVNLMPNYIYQYSINFQYVFGSGALLFWLFIMNLADMKYDARRGMAAFSAVSAGLMFASTMTGLLSVMNSDDIIQKAPVIAYLEQLPVTDESITADTFFAPALYKQKELYSISTSQNPDEKSAPKADIVLLDRNMSEFAATYNYYISQGMCEVELDSSVSFRICRLEYAV